MLIYMKRRKPKRKYGGRFGLTGDEEMKGFAHELADR